VADRLLRELGAVDTAAGRGWRQALLVSEAVAAALDSKRPSPTAIFR
jgi:hypothetical protein